MGISFFYQRFVSDENSTVNAAIVQGVRSTEKDTYTSSQLRGKNILKEKRKTYSCMSGSYNVIDKLFFFSAAIRCHFKTRKRKFNMQKNKTEKSYLKSQWSRTGSV